MNNETIKRFDITIKLRGDNVYDLYMNGTWIASRGSCENIVNEVKDVIKDSLEDTSRDVMLIYNTTENEWDIK